ncbi:hypothetical protein SK128_020295 [Halocaridina rubra]|uniref:Uncharacterized protein n=1 Tax=Halocaridina rubra TaxID=373956 RepID=A0AAN8XFH9_HALRR
MQVETSHLRIAIPGKYCREIALEFSSITNNNNGQTPFDWGGDGGEGGVGELVRPRDRSLIRNNPLIPEVSKTVPGGDGGLKPGVLFISGNKTKQIIGVRPPASPSTSTA